MSDLGSFSIAWTRICVGQPSAGYDMLKPGVPAMTARLWVYFAEFMSSNLDGANFEGAGLGHVTFRFAKLRGANFKGADLSYTDFTGAHLNGADFSGARISHTIFESATMTDVKGLDQPLKSGN